MAAVVAKLALVLLFEVIALSAYELEIAYDDETTVFAEAALSA